MRRPSPESSRRGTPGGQNNLRLAALLATAVLCGPARAWGDSAPRITRCIVSSNDRAITLFASLTDSFDSSVMEALLHGLPLRFEFQIEVVRERQLWRDQRQTAVSLFHEAKYDMITESYVFTARSGDQEEKRGTKDSGEVQRLMNSVEGTEIVPRSLLKSGRRYYINLRVRITSAQDVFDRNIFFFRRGDSYLTPWFRSPLFAIGGRPGT